jgi:adenylate kinase family enzyme
VSVGELIIVTGPPGAGKSTVSGLVADNFDSSVLIPADWFFSLWHSGAIDPWLRQAAPQTSVAGHALDARHLVTEAEAAPKDVARQILDRLSAGRLLWTAPGSSPAPEST